MQLQTSYGDFVFKTLIFTRNDRQYIMNETNSMSVSADGYIAQLLLILIVAEFDMVESRKIKLPLIDPNRLNSLAVN